MPKTKKKEPTPQEVARTIVEDSDFEPLPLFDPQVHVLDRPKLVRFAVAPAGCQFASISRDSHGAPKVELVMLYGEVMWRVGRRFMPFNAALEFELGGNQ